MGLFVLGFLIPQIIMDGIEMGRCKEARYRLNITRCDELNKVPTLPYIWSTECYCANTDKIYFDMEK